jgi:hypothetical protein
MHEIGGDGRLTRVFITFGKALIAHPLAYLVICVLGFLPLFLLTGTQALGFMTSLQGNISVIYWFGGLFVIGATAVVCVLSIKVSALPRGHIVSRAEIIAALRYVPHMMLVLGIFAGSIYGWTLLSSIASRAQVQGHSNWWIVWLLGFIFILFVLPAFLLLFPPVFVLENGTFAEKIKRGVALTRGFRWRIIGLFFVVSVVSLGVFSSLMAASISLMQWEKSQRITSWIAFTHFALFWSAISILAATLHTRIRHARGEINLPDVAEIFS